jgi:predicted negative regulator of RcsB-dependent stress response
MISIIFIVVVIAGAGWFVWRRWNSWRTPTEPLAPAGASRETLAFEAFTRGNSCLAEGKLADALAAFERARELDPKRPHVADRLAEVARRQQAARSPAVGAS